MEFIAVWKGVAVEVNLIDGVVSKEDTAAIKSSLGEEFMIMAQECDDEPFRFTPFVVDGNNIVLTDYSK